MFAKLMVNCWACSTWEVTWTAKSDWYLPGKVASASLIENLRQPGRVVLADGEDDGLAGLTADRITQGMGKEGAAKKAIGRIGEEVFLELPLPVGFFPVLTGVVAERRDEALFGEEGGGHFRARIHHGRVDQIAVFYAIEQRIAESGLRTLAAEGAVCVHQQATFDLAWSVRSGAGMGALQVVAGRGGQSQLVTHEIVEDGTRISAD